MVEWVKHGELERVMGTNEEDCENCVWGQDREEVTGEVTSDEHRRDRVDRQKVDRAEGVAE